ncbi:MAG: hypothetical protein A2Z20_09870 [Bdellovibrionales bacterium RBG_16_40_8]|nr:MAG: hypothetical protein A2Z20_09870 [Bdellovibrionales bacterium RBG_16_40_8]
MIKVNLLKNRGSGGSTVKTAATEINYEVSFDEATLEDTGGLGRDAIVKIVLIFLTTVMLMVYDGYNVSSLQEKLNQLGAEKTKWAQELEKKKPIVGKAREMQKKILELEARIKGIKDLSMTRLREIRVVDYIQNIIPEKVWLKSLDFNETELKIEGGTIADDQLSKFIETLEGKSYFKNVILLKAVEEKLDKGTVKAFTISSTLTGAD